MLSRPSPRPSRAAFLFAGLLLAGAAPAMAQTSVTAPADTATFAWRTLASLCDLVGSRPAGSPQMARAVDWAVTTLRAAGFDSVWTEPVTVPVWTRGREWARCTAPAPFDMQLLGLGLSDGTGPDGIEAEVLVVRSFEELEQRAGEATGRIVLFNMPWVDYGTTVQYRSKGASTAARHGAVACLIRSVTPFSLGTPHTGMMRYADDAPRIPAAALTVEDAARLQRLADRGLWPRVHLYMEARNLGDGPCANVVADIRGAKWPEEIVLLGAHLDSWDVGTCAHDDAAGCAMMMAAARELMQDGRRPARTVRVVLYTAEEIGVYGGRAYRDAHRDEIDRHVVAMESDSGAFAPRGFSVAGDSLAVARVAGLAAPLAAFGAGAVTAGGSGADVHPLVELGVPGIGHRVEGDTYFHFHHSPADNLDKVDPVLVSRNVEAIAGLAGALAEDPRPLPRRQPTQPATR
ncbi:MAG: M20/M25/M40 family metallo-hydrolase [bacterium]|nr:M20/M25/M40 family metallo-hydrolase [bacterium]